MRSRSIYAIPVYINLRNTCLHWVLCFKTRIWYNIAWRRGRLQRLGHIGCMEEGRILKEILYGKLALWCEDCWHRHYVLGGPCSRLYSGWVPWSNISIQGKTNYWLQQRTREHVERRAAIPSDPKPYKVMSATKTVIPTSISSARSDAATAQQEF